MNTLVFGTVEVKDHTIPSELRTLSSGTAGVVYEIIPKLRKLCTDEELKQFTTNLAMTLSKAQFLGQLTGSLMWVLYKNMCQQDITKFVASVRSPEDSIATLEFLKRYHF